MTMRKYILLAAVALIVSGCGYTLITKAQMPYTSIRIGKITNMTSTPKLQDMLYEALAEEFLKRGVSISDSAENTFEGAIYYYNLKGVAEKKKYAAEYEISIRVAFKIRDKNDNVTKEIKDISSPFIESFESQDAVNTIIAMKEQQDERAMRSLAAYLVYEFTLYLNEKDKKDDKDK
jgi:outer membrane lipopolysaccharide assembly protein LptE/RlpB